MVLEPVIIDSLMAMLCNKDKMIQIEKKWHMHTLRP